MFLWYLHYCNTCIHEDPNARSPGYFTDMTHFFESMLFPQNLENSGFQMIYWTDTNLKSNQK